MYVSKTIRKTVRNNKYKKYKRSMKRRQNGGSARTAHHSTKRSLNEYIEFYKNYKHICHQNVEPILIPLNPLNIITNKPLEKLLEISRKVLTIVVEQTYSLVPYFITPHIHITTQDKAVLSRNSGNCIAFATKISVLLSNYNIPHCFIPATIPPRLIQPGFPNYAHAVILVETPEHYILYEPAYFIRHAIVVHKNGTPTTTNVGVFKTKWYMVYNKDENKIDVSEINADGNKTPQYYYTLSIITNPSESISFPVNIHNKRIPIVKYSTKYDCLEGHFSIRLDTHRIEGFRLNNTTGQDNVSDENRGWFERFEWKDCLRPENTLEQNYEILSKWEGLTDEHCRLIGYENPDELRTIVFAIIHANKDAVPMLTSADAD